MLNNIKKYINEELQKFIDEDINKGSFIVWHYTHNDPESDEFSLKNELFVPGRGDYYGRGLYASYTWENLKEYNMSKYGRYLIEFKVDNTGKFIIMDYDEAKKIYGDENYDLISQMKRVLGGNFNKVFNEHKDLYLKYNEKFKIKGKSAPILRNIYKYLILYVDGFFYNGNRDGRACVIYNLGIIHPQRYSEDHGKTWINLSSKNYYNKLKTYNDLDQKLNQIKYKHNESGRNVVKQILKNKKLSSETYNQLLLNDITLVDYIPKEILKNIFLRNKVILNILEYNDNYLKILKNQIHNLTETYIMHFIRENKFPAIIKYLNKRQIKEIEKFKFIFDEYPQYINYFNNIDEILNYNPKNIKYLNDDKKKKLSKYEIYKVLKNYPEGIKYFDDNELYKLTRTQINELIKKHPKLKKYLSKYKSIYNRSKKYVKKKLNLKEIIKVEYKKFNIENAPSLLNEEFTYDEYYESYHNLKNSVIHDFLFDNNEDYTKKIPWITVPFNMLKRVWEDYMRFGYVNDRNLKLLDKIESRLYRNIILLDVLTYLAGHSTSSPKEDLDDIFEHYVEEYIRWKLQKPFNKNQLQIDFEKGNGYGNIPQDTNYYPDNYEKKLFQFFDKVLEEKNMLDDDHFKNQSTHIIYTLKTELLDKFYDDYIIDKDGNTLISDYGLEPLKKLLFKLENENNPNKKIPILDQILNVAHMRSDLAGWLVEGGERALSALSGYGDIGKED